MGILFQDKKIGLALLCDNAPYTLAMTLASYERSGLLNYFDEACVVFPESAGKVCETALSYGLSAESSPAEGGFIGRSIRRSTRWIRITCCWLRMTA